MRFSRRPGMTSFVAGALLLVAAAWLLLWTWSSASLRCVACDCRFELGANNPVCRLPALLSLLFFVALAAAFGAFIIGWLQRRRSKRTAT